ncbi:MAG: zinc-ribbon domain-containing protein [Holosporaceae bacterium]|jgi:predicted Zn finger-like uncharacterized protein|nr:zinc-ribbon domain-containing protein [Holosporaceae bacterium]
MIVVCPVCSCKYFVLASAVGRGKLVRCAMCGSTWQQSAESEVQRRGRTLDLVRWIVFWFVVFITIFSLFFASPAVLKIWPAAATFYEALGIQKYSKKAFIVQDLSNFFVLKDSTLYMGLRGELVNSSDSVKIISGVVISLREDSGEKKGIGYRKVWTHNLSCKKLLPNQKIVFETELQSVPYSNLICDITLDAL